MTEETNKNNDIFCSDSIFPTEQQSNSNSILSVKPKEDPDIPPVLQLEEQTKKSEFRIDCQQTKVTDKFDLNDLSPSSSKRSRTNSQDNQYTILGFLEKKLRMRVMSEQFSQKVSLS